MKRLKTVGIIVGAALLLALIALGIYGATAPSIGDLKRMGDSLVSQLQTYRTQHGQFPASLEEAGIQSPHTRYGDFYYTPVPRDDSFILRVGSDELGITVFRQSRATEWTVWQ